MLFGSEPARGIAGTSNGPSENTTREARLRHDDVVLFGGSEGPMTKQVLRSAGVLGIAADQRVAAARRKLCKLIANPNAECVRLRTAS